jgi:hypothetical protein
MSAEQLRDATCIVCPAQVFGLGQFDVVAHPEARNRLDPQVGYRRDRITGAPVCAHPYRVGLPPGAYASQSVPLPTGDELTVPQPGPADLELPAEVVDLEAWIIAVVRLAHPDAMAATLHQAEAIASERFAPREVIAAMRRVLTVELAR